MANGVPNGRNQDPIMRALVYGFQGLMVVLLAVFAWIAQQQFYQTKELTETVHALESRVTRAEESHASKAELGMTTAELARLWRELANYPTRAESPNPLFRDQVNSMDRRLCAVEKSIQNLREKAAGLKESTK